MILTLAAVAVHVANHPSEYEANNRAEQSSAQQQPAETLWRPSTWSPITVFTLLLTLATTGLWVFTAMLWVATNKAVNDGERAINAAVKSANTAERALIGLERPHTFAKIFAGEDLEAEQPYVSIVFANHGRFPAEVIACRLGFDGVLEARDDLRVVVGDRDASEPFRIDVPHDFIKIGSPDNYGMHRTAPKDDTIFGAYIQYRGVGMNTFNTWASWRWDRGSYRWVLTQQKRT